MRFLLFHLLFSVCFLTIIVLLYFFFWSLYCLFLFESWLLITRLVSSIFSELSRYWILYFKLTSLWNSMLYFDTMKFKFYKSFVYGRVSKWMFFNATGTIFHLFRGENKLYFDDNVCLRRAHQIWYLRFSVLDTLIHIAGFPTATPMHDLQQSKRTL